MEVFAMRKFVNYFVNNIMSELGYSNNKMVKNSWGRDEYKRIDSREEIKDNKYKANLYVDSA